MTLKAGDRLVLVDDVTRDYTEGRSEPPSYEVIEPPQYFTDKEGGWITVRLRET